MRTSHQQILTQPSQKPEQQRMWNRWLFVGKHEQSEAFTAGWRLVFFVFQGAFFIWILTIKIIFQHNIHHNSICSEVAADMDIYLTFSAWLNTSMGKYKKCVVYRWRWTTPLTQPLPHYSVKGRSRAPKSQIHSCEFQAVTYPVNLWSMMPSEAWGGTQHYSLWVQRASIFDGCSERERERSAVLLWV